MDLSKISNPRITGPGQWVVIHEIAYYDDVNGQKFYTGFIRNFCERFRCGECRPHCISFQKNNPPDKYLKQKWGMSRHSFDFHNAVNKRLGKPLMDWNTYSKLYIEKDESGVCQEGCDDTEKKISSVQEVSPETFKKLYNVGKKSPDLVIVKENKGTEYRTKKDHLTIVKRK